jgi:hypothetical protein
MAARFALARVRREVFSDDLPIATAVDQLCRDARLLWRDRLLTPLVTLGLFVLQVLHGNTSIAHLRQLCGVDFAQSSYCEARQRLPLEVIRGLLVTMLQWAGQSANAMALLGQRVFICDASSHSMSDTPGLRKFFGLPPGTKPGVGYPVAKVMGLMDVATGLFAALIGVPLFTHDMRHVLQGRGASADQRTADQLRRCAALPMLPDAWTERCGATAGQSLSPRPTRAPRHPQKTQGIQPHENPKRRTKTPRNLGRKSLTEWHS